MKALSILVLIGAYILGMHDGDTTVAVVLTLLFIPILFERRDKKCTTQNFRTAERH